jgi:hypothetical protein
MIMVTGVSSQLTRILLAMRTRPAMSDDAGCFIATMFVTFLACALLIWLVVGAGR